MAQIFFRKKLQVQRTLGTRLKSARKKRKLTLSQAEEETKVRLKYLKALEDGDYLLLPADVYALGFLAKYADFLGLPKEEILRQFRQEKGRSALINPIKVKERKEKFYFTSRTAVYFLGILAVIALAGYIFYSVKHFTTPPNLEISSPSTDTVVRQESVAVVGKTDIGSSLMINGQTVYLDTLGNFNEVVRLQPGINNIEVRSINRTRKESAKVIQILAEY